MTSRDTHPTPPSGMPAPTSESVRPMNDELSAKFTMIHRDIAELRRADEEFRRSDERHENTLANLKGDTEHLKSQNKQLFEQQMEHGKMLLEHAKLHTQHAESIASAKEQARVATQSSTDLSKEWRDAAQAIDKHVAAVAGAQAETSKKTSEQVQRLATAQEQSNLARADEAKERALQTIALNKLVEMMKSPRIAIYVAIGAIVGGALMAIVGKVLP